MPDPLAPPASSPPRSPPRRLTVGALLDNLDDGYQRSLWVGLEQAAREAGVNVVHFLGGNLNPRDPAARRRNGIFDLIGPESVDGLVIPSMVVASHIGSAGLEEYCRRFRPLPMVSLGAVLPSMPSIVVEGGGIRALVTHLVQHHGRRRLAFMAGTQENPDSALRERVFRETLASLGLPLDERLVLRGNFLPELAGALVCELVELRVPFDAVVCATDEMAAAVIDSLAAAGLLLPEAVSVTGYDDIPAAQRQPLPLTTVRQPILALARRGLEVLLELVAGRPVGPIEALPTEHVVRRSCGCFTEQVVRAGEPVDPGAGDLVGQGAAGLSAAMCGQLRNAGEVPAGADACAQELAQALADEVRGVRPEGTFVALLDLWLRSAYWRGLPDTAWEDLLTALHREALPRLGAPEAIEARLQQARVLLRETARQGQWRAYTQLARRTQTLQYVIENLVGSFDIPTLLDGMARELPRIGIARCFLAVHASAERAYQDARLLMAYDEEGRLPVGEGIAYSARRVLPEGLPRGPGPWNLVLQPLIFEEEEVGFLALSYDPRDDVSSLALSDQIRSALKASSMMQEIREKDRRLLEIDRMRNDFVANVTHDFRSLVGIILEASGLAQRPDGPAEPAALRELLGTTYEAALRLKVAIDRLLDLASMDERGLVVRIRKFQPRRYLTGLAAFYRPVLAVSGIALELELPEKEVEDLYTDPDKVEQIMHNLVSNAARFVEPQRGRIRFSLTVREEGVEIAVADDGEGIAPERLEEIFVRFGARRKEQREGGAGIGLPFARELASYLRGAIRAESEGPGKGARFLLSLPRGKDVHADAVTSEERAEEAPETAAVREQFRQLLESSLRVRMAERRKPQIG
jgi:DNA-binding LacI/PurR family transcriptional regulator/signal transduction histidine kinase